MIRHIVMWKLKEFAEGNSKEINARKVKTSLESLKALIPSIVELEVGIDIGGTGSSYDVVLSTTFLNMEDLSAYQTHPEHMRVGEFIGKVREKRVVADYEI